MTEKFKSFLRSWLIKNGFSSNIELSLTDDECLHNFGADSLDEVDFIIYLEKEYGIELTNKEVEELNIRKMPFKYLSEYLEDQLRKKYKLK